MFGIFLLFLANYARLFYLLAKKIFSSLPNQKINSKYHYYRRESFLIKFLEAVLRRSLNTVQVTGSLAQSAQNCFHIRMYLLRSTTTARKYTSVGNFRVIWELFLFLMLKLHTWKCIFCLYVRLKKIKLLLWWYVYNDFLRFYLMSSQWCQAGTKRCLFSLRHDSNLYIFAELAVWWIQVIIFYCTMINSQKLIMTLFKVFEIKTRNLQLKRAVCIRRTN